MGNAMTVQQFNTSMINKSLVVAGPPEAVGWLTPDVLMQYCQSKIRGIDAQVQAAFKGQKSRGDLSKALSNLATELSGRSKGVHQDDQGAKQKITEAYDKAIADAGGPQTTVGAQLAEQREAFVRTTTGKETNNDEDKADAADWEMKNFLDNASRIQQDVNREGELEMIQLQSLMSQRQQALQMCTNMVQSLGQSSNAIAQNIGK
jgi:hypothetical protein